MTTYTAYFRGNAEFATKEFVAKTPEKALRMARDFLEQHGDELDFEPYDHGGMAVDEIEICTDGADELAVWRGEDLRLRLAARDLLKALQDQTELAQKVIDNWTTGDLAAAVRALGATLPESRAAIAWATDDGR